MKATQQSTTRRAMGERGFIDTPYKSILIYLLSWIFTLVLFTTVVKAGEGEMVDKYDFVIYSQIDKNDKLANHEMWKGDRDDAEDWLVEMDKAQELIRVLREAGCTGVVFMSWRARDNEQSKNDGAVGTSLTRWVMKGKIKYGGKLIGISEYKKLTTAKKNDRTVR